MTIDWFRSPTDSPADGTGNAAYNALDRHVVRGRADEVAVVVGEREWTYAELLAESAAFAGVLGAFGVGSGDEVVVGRLPETQALLVALAGARLGAVCRYVDDLAEAVDGTAARAAVAATDPGPGSGPGSAAPPVITVDDTGELSWAVTMRAGRTDPAACADMRGDGVLALVGERVWTLSEALGATSSPTSAPEGVAVEVGGVTLWSWAGPARGALP
jgi:hypothetical protein